MPKAQPSSFASSSRAASNLAPILKRNQACHQCRRRKLKCDAKKPCTTCVRSHRNAVNHSVHGASVPPLECTFDEVVENSSQSHPLPKSRYEKLENRISELEALLREKDEAARKQIENVLCESSASGLRSAVPSVSSFIIHNEAPYPISEADPLENVHTQLAKDVPLNAHISPVASPPQDHIKVKELQGNEPFNTQILWSNWPHELPSYELLHHLVQVFFAFHPHSNLLFHGPSFLASLSLPPTHPGFPHIAVLHSICALGSFYSVAVPQPPLPNFAETAADDIFPMGYKRRKAMPDSFGEKHAKYALAAINIATDFADRLVECQQANVIIGWFFHCHARWSDVFLHIGRATRYLTPLGINMCPPFHSISNSLRVVSLLPSARTVIEDETRRNTFWLTYAIERYLMSSNGWPMSLDDQDITQLLPIRADQFQQGILVPPRNRQWAHIPGVLLTHPPDQTDSFVLYIKGAMLLSRVKTFNLRFRAKHFAGDPAMISPRDRGHVDQCSVAQYIDPRDTEGFEEVDWLLSSFVPSFPPGFKNPIKDSIVDNHLLVAIMAPSVGQILLHEPHALLQRKGCISSQKLLEASLAILKQAYNLLSTSFDLVLLDNFCSFAFYMAGRILTRFLGPEVNAFNESGNTNVSIRTEIEYLRIVLIKIGTRMPVAYRYVKMLNDNIIQAVGRLDIAELPGFTPPAFPLGPEFQAATSAVQEPSRSDLRLDMEEGLSVTSLM